MTPPRREVILRVVRRLDRQRTDIESVLDPPYEVGRHVRV